VRGEHPQAKSVFVSKTGSSPRARGTPARAARRAVSIRFIPACAGNTPSIPAFSAVHPRVRGEHKLIQGSSHDLNGSSRVRGEHVSFTIYEQSDYGSSPRARGTRAEELRAGHRRRFIPACAGNTTSSACFPNEPTVHPRVRGEHTDKRDSISAMSGSSPRARGTRSTKATSWWSHRVHPRVRGEHDLRRQLLQGNAGSSPRARGTLVFPAPGSLSHRFIPACAGNTQPGSGFRGLPAVHPRVRGEHTSSMSSPRCLTGSSPRARGTPRRRARGTLFGQAFVLLADSQYQTAHQRILVSFRLKAPTALTPRRTQST
jgi:hypothetical protein